MRWHVCDRRRGLARNARATSSNLIDEKSVSRKTAAVSAHRYCLLMRDKFVIPFSSLAVFTAGMSCSPARAVDKTDAPHAPSEVKLRVDADMVVYTMRGGFGASWHAIELPIPVQGDRSHGGSAWGGNPPAEEN